MLVNEARWFAARLRELGDEAIYPQLNVGSHSADFRTREQPWIDRELFARPRARGLSVIHTDLREEAGVELAGDLLDADFRARLAAARYRSVFCCNLLEHVSEREPIAQALVEATAPGGYLLTSVPHVFPFHPDPIDTLYRPAPEEFASLFPGATLIRGERVACGNLATYLAAKALADPGALAANLFRRRRQAVERTEAGLSLREWLPWCVRTFVQTCLVLRRNGG